MLFFEDIKIEFKCQGFEAKQISFSPEKHSSVIMFKSTQSTQEVRCPACGGQVYIYDSFEMNIKDIPLWKNIPLKLFFMGHRYRCIQCGETFTEEIPFRYPGTRITYRAANWIKGFLQEKVSIRSIQRLTGIHWDTIRMVQQEVMNEALSYRQQELKANDYKPKYLAVDEFAIHKGHSYATCVMDLETGDVLWVGKGRAKADFAKFFEETNPATLSAVMAVAMDMNASYNKLVEQHLPNAEIVYDRYHMQAQYGKEVLGVVRLEEARKHNSRAKEILANINEDADKETKIALKKLVKAEKSQYNKLKKSRWTLLRNSRNLSDKSSEYLDNILQEHENLAVCYAMKEEMCRLFENNDYSTSVIEWSKWFEAAKASGIPALVHFAQLKEKRIPGLAAHAAFPISTGKLEGFNNKIKVAKRIGYGYRNEEYFFTLIRYLALPSVRLSSPNFP